MTPKDKELHFWAGVTVGIFALVIFKSLDIKHCWLFVTASVLLVAAGKEAKDYLDYGRPDWRDAVYTIAGGVPAVLLSFF